MLLQVSLVLVIAHVLIALYLVLSKAALSTGMDAGVFTIIRDSLCSCVLVLFARHQGGSFLWPTKAADHLCFIFLGVFGLYFGQYCATLALKYGTPMLSATWQNSIPLVTYLLGLLLRVEELNCRMPSVFRLAGLLLAVAGAIVTTIATAHAKEATSSDSKSQAAENLLLASVFSALQVLFGGAGFWHLQKVALEQNIKPILVAAWYYTYGVLSMTLVILPNSLDARQWTFEGADLTALCYAVAVWPLAAYLLTYANARAGPVMVMAFSPLQIIITSLLDYILESVRPTIAEMGGAGLVIAGLSLFIAGTWIRREGVQVEVVAIDDQRVGRNQLQKPLINHPNENSKIKDTNSTHTLQYSV